MFQNLDEQIETTEGGRPSTRGLIVRFLGVAVILAALFAGLYLAIASFE